MSKSRVTKTIVPLLCVVIIGIAYADTARYEVTTAVGKISLSAPVLYAQTIPYVSLDELMHDLGGSVRIAEEQCQANYNSVTANLTPDTVSVSTPGSTFSLLYPARLHDGKLFLAKADMERFFSQAYQVHLIPTISQNAEPPAPEASAPLDEDFGSLLEVLPLPEQEQEDIPEGPASPTTTEPQASVAEEAPVSETERAMDISFPDTQAVLVLDAGHGGRDTGSTAGAAIAEKDITLAILLRLRSLLKERTTLTIHLTRDTDKEITTAIRAKTANALKGDLLLSVHAGYSNVQRRNGVVFFTDQLPAPPDAKADSEIRHAFMLRRSCGEQASKLAYTMAELMATDNALGPVRVRKAPLLLQQTAEMPCILVELAYLNNPDITALITEEEYQLRIAEMLAHAIIDALPKTNN